MLLLHECSDGRCSREACARFPGQTSFTQSSPQWVRAFTLFGIWRLHENSLWRWTQERVKAAAAPVPGRTIITSGLIEGGHAM
jgi:hypothetical protein